jgi:nitric oxide reductase large subunit
MEYGSIFGHGAYLGPDFTDDYLHRYSEIVRNELGGTQSDSARQATIDQFQTNRYDSDTKTLPFSARPRALRRDRSAPAVGAGPPRQGGTRPMGRAA